MKAAVLNKLGKTPVFDDFKDPQVTSDSYCLMNVKASALKNLDRLMTRREFYAHYEELPAVIGTDAVGVLEWYQGICSRSRYFCGENVGAKSGCSKSS